MSGLEIEKLSVRIGTAPILTDVSLAVAPGQIVGLIGESGSGKSMTALAIMGLLPEGAVAQGAITLDGTPVLGAPEAALRAVRGARIGMVFQEPMTALNPLKTIGAQVAETILVHRRAGRREALALARTMLDRVGLPAPQFELDRYPHELSGGQRQRVVIAMAIALRPQILIADEPTTALDVTTQAQILSLLKSLVQEDGMGLLLITHDLAVVAEMAHEIAILQQGVVVERGPTRSTFGALQHPYSRALLAASAHRPHRTPPRPSPGAVPVLDVEDAVRDYRLPRQSLLSAPERFRAVDGVSFSIAPGETVGLVGESGSGKSTLARAIMALEPLDGGTIRLDGEVLDAGRGPSRAARAKMQVVFQDPYGSFNPRHRVGRLVSEPFHLLGRAAPSGAARTRAVAEALEHVGLRAADAGKFIHEFSGGQRQRIAIARALIIAPKLIVLDEAVSALDVSLRAQILDLLAELSGRLRLSYLFIAHDLHVVRAITDRVLVMQKGRIVEAGPTESVFANPTHPYTQALLAAAPSLERALGGA